MLRDNLVGLIEPMLSSAGAYPLALCTALRKSSDDRPPCLENPRPVGAESTLTENVASPFHAEPRQENPELQPDILIMSFVRELSATLFRASAVGNILKDSKRKNEPSSKFGMENTTGGA
jgi:hypothetical protein